MSLRPKRLKSRSPVKPRVLRGGHRILASTVDNMDDSRAANRAFRHDVLPIISPSGIRAAYPSTHLTSRASSADLPSAHPSGSAIELSETPGEQESENSPPITTKRDTQWKKWTQSVMPPLILQFLHLQRTTHNFTRVAEPLSFNCTCGGKDSKHLEILCLHFATLRKLNIYVCSCCPAPTQLLDRGLFPCAPTFPTLAVDLKLLEFARIQFLTMIPNVLGWCEAVELFLRSMLFKLTTKDTLRQRFSNALRWYYTLLDGTTAYMLRILDTVSEELQVKSPSPHSRQNAALPPSSPVASQSRPSSPTSATSSPVLLSSSLDSPPPSRASTLSSCTPTASTSPSSESVLLEPDPKPPIPPSGSRVTSPEPPVPEPQHAASQSHSRPSLYLRRRCPICFGGNLCHDSQATADFIVSIDACFTQKRTKYPQCPTHRDGHRAHHDTCFLPEEDVSAMEVKVAAARAASTRKPQSPAAEDSDDVEHGMGVPTSVLNDCNDSFIAADEKRKKASTQHFSDTGLMALICRHDRLIFVVNMTHPGKRQHYALALLRALFSHLPPDMTVGLLYDIGCQLKRSMLKYGFLEDVFGRITFAVSVFHAYGHQWACQVVYHPRKCCGFGLSDGEGCERLWSALRKLIPTLRVSGYHQHLFVLDTQVEHLTDKSTESLGSWLQRRWHSNKDPGYLRKQWAAQVKAQTAPAPRQSKNKGVKAVQDILILDGSISTESALVNQLHKDLVAERGDTYDTAQLLQDAEG
ncbi:hypothetical protein HWV62_29352 [Athelia sp. TMB]|nr:hypothetical protein HWV62_29352 [Athelia sp. TMB]